MAYNVGEAYISIQPSFVGTVQAIQREAEKWGIAAAPSFARRFADGVRRELGNADFGPSAQASTRSGESTGKTFADGFKAKIETALRSLPKIELNADSSPADARIASIRENLKELSGQRIGIDINEADAVAKIEILHRQLTELATETPSISVRADTVNAARQLDQLRLDILKVADSDPTVDVKADTGAADAKLAATKAAADSLNNKNSSINVGVVTGPALAGIGIIRTALLRLSEGAVITPVLGGLGALLGPLAAVGLGGGALAGASLPGLSNIKNVLAAQTAQSSSSSGSGSGPGSGAAQAQAQAVAAAANQIKAAKLSLATTERQIANDKITSDESVAKAETAVGTAQKQAAADAVTSAQKVQAAEAAVGTARTSAASAIAAAAQKVVTAEQGVVTAQRASLAAQKALSDAREAAARSLQDSAFSVQDAQLTLQADQLAIIQAQQNLNAVNASSTSTDLQKQEAALALAQAQQALVEQQVTAQRATEDNTKAQKAGVDGSKQVVTAQQGVANAQAGIVKATDAVTAAQSAQATATTAGAAKIAAAQAAIGTARTAAAQKAVSDAAKIKAAEQGLADARRAQAFQEANDASSLVSAHQAVANAQLAAANAANKQSTATNSQSSASNRLAAALAKLTPQEKILLNSVEQFKKTFTSFGQSLEPVTIPLFTGGIKILTDLLPKLEPLIRATASALGDVEKSFAKAINGPGAAKFLDTMTKLAGPSIKGLASILGNLGGVIAHLAEAFAPLSGVVLGGLGQLTAALSKAASGPGMQAFVKTIGQIAPLFAQTLGSVGGLLGKLVGALAPLAGPVLSVINTLAKALSTLVAGLAGPLKQAFDQLAPIINELIAKLLPPFTQFLTSVIGLIPSLAQAFSDVVIAALPLLPIITELVKLAGPMIQFLAPLAPYILGAVVAIKAITLVMEAWTAITKVVTAVTEALNLALDTNVISIVIIAIAALVAALILAYEHSATFRDIVKEVWTVIKTVIADAWRDVIKPVFDAFVLAIEAIVTAFLVVKDALVKAFKAFAADVSIAWHAIGSAISTAWNDSLGIVKSAYHAVESFLTGAWHKLASTAGRAWEKVAGAIGGAFGAVKGALSSVWHDVEKIFAGAVNFITQDVLNPLIGVLNDVLGLFGIKIKPIHAIQVSAPSASSGVSSGTAAHGHGTGYATGGVLPGYAPGRDTMQIWASPGEGILVPEAVRGIGGAAGVQQINSMFSARVSDPGHFAGGGVIPPAVAQSLSGFSLNGVFGPSVFDEIGSALGKVKDAIRAGAADVAISALKVAEAPIKALIGTANSGLARKLGGGVFDKINSEVFDFIRGHVTKPKAASGGSGGSIPTGQHKSLIDQALGLSGVPLSPGNESAVNTIVVNESGWNPNAINRTDSNAQAGHPSQGLSQTIPSTFEAYRLGSLPDDITNPLANLVAGIRYAVSTYGSLGNVPGVVGVGNGSGYVGYDSGGFIPPGVSTVFNGTGRPEPVLTSEQWAQITQGSSEVNVQVSIGNEAIDPRMVRISHTTIDSRLSTAVERSQRGVPGGALAQLAR